MNIDHNKDYNSAAPNRSGNNEQDNNIVDSGKIIYADPCISDELLQPKMKSVRFYGKVKVYRSADPSASDMSTNEKQKRWYNNSEYNQFKHEAASHAGVNIVPCDDPNNKSPVPLLRITLRSCSTTKTNTMILTTKIPEKSFVSEDWGITSRASARSPES